MTRKTPFAGLATSPAANLCTATAAAFTGSIDSEGFPPASVWSVATSIRFNTDWQGQNEDPKRQTEVRLLWTPATLYLQFIARYRVITVFDDADANGRRDKLWDRDVVECFLQPDPSDALHYYEFEVSPNGYWIDLDISHGQLGDLKSDLQRRVHIDKHTWTAELAIPMRSLVQNFDPGAIWRVNFFRVEGPVEPRFYSAWQPTDTPQPNFHVPERFGYLKFEPAGR
jgi:Carbohydrate family 9 binding domain-like